MSTFNNHKLARSRIILYISVPQRRMLKRMCDDDNVTLMEAIRVFSAKQIKRYSDAGLWFVIKPEKYRRVLSEDREILCEA